MIAFVRTLQKKSTDQYKAAIAGARADHDEMMKEMPGMKPMDGMTPERNAPAAAPALLSDTPQPHGHTHSH